jgi:hypothetical protein
MPRPNDVVIFEGMNRFNKILVGTIVTRYWAPTVVAGLVILLWAPRLSGPIDLRWDAGVYYILGTSLATGHGYRILSEPGSPEALQYPPLLPAVVALHQRALGSTDPAVVAPWLRKVNLIIFVLYAFGVLCLAQRYLPIGFAVAAVSLCLLHFMTIFISDLLSVDLPFALTAVFFVLVAGSRALASRLWLREVASFALAAAGFFLRTAGVALLAAWVLEAVARRRWRLAIVRGVSAALPVLSWQSHVARVQASYEYAHPAYEYQRAPYQFYNVSYAENIGLIGDKHVHLPALTAHLGSNLGPILTGLGESVSTSGYYWRQFLADMERLWTGRRDSHPVLVLVPMMCFSALVITGLVIVAIRRAWLMLFVPVISIGLMWATPWPDQFQRYLMPLAPFLVVAAMLPLSQLQAGLRASTEGRPFTIIVVRVAIAGFVLLALSVQTYTAGQLFYQRWRNAATFGHGSKAGSHYFYFSRGWQAWEKAVAWLGANSPPEAIVATPQRHLCYLRTNRRAVIPPMETDPKRAKELLEAVPVSYVIIDQTGEMASFGRRYALPAVKEDSLSWPLAYSVDGTQIYARASSPK